MIMRLADEMELINGVVSPCLPAFVHACPFTTLVTSIEAGKLSGAGGWDSVSLPSFLPACLAAGVPMHRTGYT